MPLDEFEFFYDNSHKNILSHKIEFILNNLLKNWDLDRCTAGYMYFLWGWGGGGDLKI